MKKEAEDYRIISKLMKLVESNNFTIDAWLPLVDSIHDKRLRDFLNAFRCYAEYLITVRHDGVLPRRAYELAFKNAKDEHMHVISSFDKKIKELLRSIK